MYFIWGTRQRGWLRHFATSRKVVGSDADDAIRVFHCHNPSGSNMALWLTQPLIKMSTRNTPWEVKVTGDLTIFRCRLSGNLSASSSWNPQGPSRPMQGSLYLYHVCYYPLQKCYSYVFFWVIPRCLNFIYRRFGTLCLFHLHRQVGVEWHLFHLHRQVGVILHLPAYEDGTDRVLRNVGI